ncbi:MAG: hypothetical protein HC902_07540, partial [Calothrix sp. SM1_5_4]|nr:hypothetical protein [Calothrix sp. SM1_5_4]
CNPLDYNVAASMTVPTSKSPLLDGSRISDFTVQGNKLTFGTALPVGSYQVKYYCVE